MGLGALYADLERKGLDDACAYVVTLQNKVLEIYYFAGVLIRLKSVQLSIDQMLEVLLKGDIRDAVLRDMPVGPIDADPATIIKTLSSAAYASLKLPGKASHLRLSRQLHLLQHLSTGETAEHDEAIALIAKEISRYFPTFSMDYETMRSRGTKLEQEFGIIPRIAFRPAASASVRETLRWVFDAYGFLTDPHLQEIFLVFLFLGEAPSNTIATVVDKSTGLGSKPGAARLSKNFYPALTGYSAAALFKGTTLVANIKIEWVADKKGSLFLTKSDMDAMRLNSGDKITVMLR